MAVHSAVLVADSLLEQGTIGRVRTTRGQTTYQADSDALFRGWPIAVLVDQNTAGAAEWLAAALQDNHRAVVVGSPSRGAHQARPFGGLPMEDDGAGPFEYEATVKSTVPVGDGRWSIAMVTGHLERGDGRPLADVAGAMLGASSSIEKPRGGVRPDHVIPGPRPGFGVPRDPFAEAHAGPEGRDIEPAGREARLVRRFDPQCRREGPPRGPENAMRTPQILPGDRSVLPGRTAADLARASPSRTSPVRPTRRPAGPASRSRWHSSTAAGRCSRPTGAAAAFRSSMSRRGRSSPSPTSAADWPTSPSCPTAATCWPSTGRRMSFC